jgi:hypothetical protein
VLRKTWLHDTNANTWTEIESEISPPARTRQARWCDPAADLTFVFGGDADGTAWPALPWEVLGGRELWSFDVETASWTLFASNRIQALARLQWRCSSTTTKGSCTCTAASCTTSSGGSRDGSTTSGPTVTTRG